VRICAFCPNPVGTGEHVWSAWIGELFKSKGYNFSRTSLQTKAVSQWRKPKLNEKTNVLCAGCNNGWMSLLEDRAKAAFSGMIRDGTRICLLSRGLVLLAAFAFKCAVVSDYARGDGDVFFSRLDRYRFRESLQIPSGARMWIAALHDPVGHRGADTHFWTSVRHPRFRDLQLYTYNFVAGHLVLQVHAARWTALHKQGGHVPRIELSTYWDTGAAIQFWPNESGFPIEWPPPVHIDSKLLQQFIYRWNGNIDID
jgi:hypothetical protein